MFSYLLLFHVLPTITYIMCILHMSGIANLWEFIFKITYNIRAISTSDMKYTSKSNCSFLYFIYQYVNALRQAYTRYFLQVLLPRAIIIYTHKRSWSKWNLEYLTYLYTVYLRVSIAFTNKLLIYTYSFLFVVFLALQPTVVVFLQPGSGL
jgi:hypothetical protein